MSRVVVVDAQNIMENIRLPLSLVDFWAPWCAPCRAVAPVLDQLAGEYGGRLVVGKLNVDENGPIAAQYNVMGIPTLVLFSGGNEVARLVGAQSKEKIKEMIDNQLN